MEREIDIKTWNRRRTYEFFKDFEDPFFNMTANLDVSKIYTFCAEYDFSYSLACLFFSQQTVNEIPEFRIRQLDNKLVQYDLVEATQTILQDDETFSFCYFEHKPNIFQFDQAGKEAREKYKALNTFDVETERLDLIYYSVIPWVSFTSFKHATRFDKTQTIPRIVFGKYFYEGDVLKMPVSVEANHTIMDGIHVGKYFNQFQGKLDSVD